MTTLPPTEEKLLTLADRLRAEGRFDDALLVSGDLKARHPRHPGVRIVLARALGAKGQVLEALGELAAARDLGADPAAFLSHLREQSLPAVNRFNAALAAGDMAQAEPYAAALATLAPQSPPMLAAAMTCNQALGRLDRAAYYAGLLLTVEPANLVAHELLADIAKGAGDVGAEGFHRAAIGLVKPDLAPLLRLRDLHDAAGQILCGPLPLAANAEAQLASALKAALELPIPVEPGSEWETWERHYRLLLEAIDLPAARAPTPQARLHPAPNWTDAAGKPIDAAAVQARAGQARAVFFAAADEAYVDLYARWYALSILKYADVPFLVVIHVIGGRNRLSEIAARVGVDDPRLVWAGDDFDREKALRTDAIDAPPKGKASAPIAHFQSVRFQRLGALLALTQKPVFVSDIDLILQRGVADLLDRTAGDDLVLNENTLTTTAGARLTANLLLLNPTPTAAAFLNFLSAFLEDRLAGSAVTRWIDQAALTMSRLHLSWRHPQAKIGYFDTASDINNVMYRSYQEHPFRFLSLFHGFDTSTLEGDARVAGEEAAAAPKAKKKGGRR